MNLTLGGGGEKIVSLVALLICLGTTNVFVASISRLAYSLAHEGVAPKWLDHVNERYSTPDHDVLLVAIFSGTGLLVTLVCNLSMKTSIFQTLSR
jgi:amino acid efflux transporter